ncbi:MAG TPA: oligosaccharide flippase family protein [Gemmatimonadales bacterium]|nr:oligosaccharide flippase family protein [Gemmatimonadales bacterium]
MESHDRGEGPIDARHELRRGLWWLGAATVAMRLLDVAGSLLVLQFLLPGDVGLAALAWSFSVALEAFNGLGVGQVVVREEGLTHRQLSGLFWFSTLLGVAAVAVMAPAAPFIAEFYADWRLAPMIVVSAGKLVFVGAALVPLQLLTRRLDFRTAGAVQTVATLGEAVTKVVLVVTGFGAWSLVIANVSRGAWLCLALWRWAPFRPALAVEDESTRRAVRFGLRVTASNAVYHVYRNMDFLLIGRVLGTRVLGIYQIAFQLGMTPLEVVLQLVNRVQYPIYARLQHHAAELRDAFYRSARSLLLVLGPVAAVICFASADVLALFQHGIWLPAVPLVQILVWASLVRGIAQLFPQLYLATGRPEFAVYDSLITGAALVGGFGLALYFAPAETGAWWVAWVWLLSYPIALAAHFYFARKVSEVTSTGMAASLLRPAVGLAVVSLALWLTTLARPLIGSAPVSLGLLVAVGLGAHALYLHRVMHLRLGELLPRRQA